MTSQVTAWCTVCNMLTTMTMMVTTMMAIRKFMFYVFFCILFKIDFNNIQKQPNNPPNIPTTSRHVVSKL